MQNESETLWEVALTARPGFPDGERRRADDALRSVAAAAAKLHGGPLPAFAASHGFLISAAVSADDLRRIARATLADPVAEDIAIAPALGSAARLAGALTTIRKPGVTDPAAETAQAALAAAGLPTTLVRRFRRVRFATPLPEPVAKLLAKKALGNDAIELVVAGGWRPENFGRGAEYRFQLRRAPLLALDDAGLLRLSKDGQLYLNLEEMRAIQAHFAAQGREPTDIELETLAQTWSEHCSHKTLRGPYVHNGVPGRQGLLKDTIFLATEQLAKDWCVSVFRDNAGIVKFDDGWNVCIKVETHNRPSAIEPYGGANTGLGGVIRDVLGCGLGGKPICSTDVFCVAPPDTPADSLPDGVLHPERVLRGVVAGVRDYGNRMGIPTVNGAVACDPRFVGNPLVFCGTVGLMPADKCFGAAAAGDLIVALGGRTGRDGIHGATFSSGELTSESETVSGGAVQIGNAITEKQTLDIVLQARDRGLFRAITDCGAGGFSSAVGEMAAELGAEVQLEAAPLKYAGLSYTEIWISEAQERMVLAVPPEHWPALRELAASEDVEAAALGTFTGSGRLRLNYAGHEVGDLDMHFLHEGRPSIVRTGEWRDPPAAAWAPPRDAERNLGAVLRRILGSWNVASKEWIVRQYDHEVQGGSVVKPLTGAQDDGPSDAAVVAPIPGRNRAIAVGCGLAVRFGDASPYRMAASAIDEALRNVVAVGGDPSRTALLDNFCWGNTDRPEVFGALCEAAFACRDLALAFGTPFVSGKDSLKNEFRGADGARIAIPPTLLITALAQVPDLRRCTTMDLKEPGNRLLAVGWTKPEMGGSHFNLVCGVEGGEIPAVDAAAAKATFARVHAAIAAGLVRSCHDCSEGGFAVAAAEMAFAGGLGAELDADALPAPAGLSLVERLFSESNSRFLLEVAPENLAAVLELLADAPHADLGAVTAAPRLAIRAGGLPALDEPLADLKEAWQAPLRW